MSRAALAVALVAAACGGGGDDTGVDASQVWTQAAPLAMGPRLEVGLVELGGLLYAIGGIDDNLDVVGDVEVWDPASDAWQPRAPLPVPMTHLDVAAAGGRVLVLGGLTGRDFVPSGLCFAYDPGADQWTPLASMPAGAERGAAAVAVLGGQVVVAGGAVTDASTARADLYDVAGDSWTALADLPAPRSHPRGAAIGGRAYVVGGMANLDGTGAFTDVYSWAPGETGWTPHAALAVARGGCAIGVVGDRIVCAGGESTRAHHDTDAYDPVTDLWTPVDGIPDARAAAGGAALAGQLHVVGGAQHLAYDPLDTHWVLTPP